MSNLDSEFLSVTSQQRETSAVLLCITDEFWTLNFTLRQMFVTYQLLLQQTNISSDNLELNFHMNAVKGKN
jgi:hypothetical protein